MSTRIQRHVGQISVPTMLPYKGISFLIGCWLWSVFDLSLEAIELSVDHWDWCTKLLNELPIKQQTESDKSWIINLTMVNIL